MTETLATLTYRVASNIPNFLSEATATGGSKTTIIDTVNRITENEPDDYWNSGTGWVVKDAGGAGAAPQGEFDIISDFASTTGTLTFATGFTVAVGAGDRYAISKRKYSKEQLIQGVNVAIADLGKILVVDSTSVTTAANQTEYELPVGVTDDNLRRVYFQTNDDDTDDNRWQEIYNWRVQKTTIGSAPLLILPEQFPSSYSIQLHYAGEHDPLYAYSDKLCEGVPWERIVYRAAWWVMTNKQRGTNTLLQQRIDTLATLAADAITNHPLIIPPKTPRIIYAAKRYESTDIDKVHL